MMADIVEMAKNLAIRAHSGQVDKAGRPYIEHVARVAASVRGDDLAEAVAWLHDVLEDCDVAFRAELMASFPASIVHAVQALTRVRGISEHQYLGKIRQDATALRVKLADISDNSNEERLALLDPLTAARLRKKYQKAVQALEGGRNGSG